MTRTIKKREYIKKKQFTNTIKHITRVFLLRLRTFYQMCFERSFFFFYYYYYFHFKAINRAQI